MGLDPQFPIPSAPKGSLEPPGVLRATSLENHRRSSSSATERAQSGAQERQRLGAYGLGGLGPAPRSPAAPVLGPPWFTRGRPGEVIVESLGRGVARSRGPAPRDRPHPRPLPQPHEDSRLLPLLVCLRVLFVPLFMLCHVPERSRLPILFPQDAYFITFMLLFAVSNGYLVSLTMCLAPRSGAWGGEGRAWEQGDGLGRLETDSRQGSGFRPARPELFLQASLVPRRQVRPSLLNWPQARS